MPQDPDELTSSLDNQNQQDPIDTIDKGLDKVDQFNKTRDFAKDKLNLGKKGAKEGAKEVGKEVGKEAGKEVAKKGAEQAAKVGAQKAAESAAVSAAGSGAAAGGAAAGGAAAGGGVAAAATPVIGIAAIVIAVIIAVLTLVGAIVSLIYLPGSLKSAIKGFFKKIKVYFMGEDYALDDADFAEVANYIRDRGYDLYAEGFINKELDPETDLDDDGKIKKLPAEGDKALPHLIELYARMDAYTYRVRNAAMFRFFAKGEDMAGFLNFKIGVWENNDLVEEKNFDWGKQGVFSERIKVDRDAEMLHVKKGWFQGEYNYSMQGWAGRYGLPLELFMALHQGTKAPDLVREIAKGTQTYSDKEFTQLVTDYSADDDLFYKKPILEILLLETKAQNVVNFLVPANSVINGYVYVLKDELDFDKEYETNPFIFDENSFERRSELSKDMIYKSFFRLDTGEYIRIKPKKGHVARFYTPPADSMRKPNGAPNVSPVKTIEKDDKTYYKIVEENYDLSKLFFDKKGDKFYVKDMTGEIINKKKFIKHDVVYYDGMPANTGEFVDTFGLYNVASYVIDRQSGIDGGITTFHGFSTRIRELMYETDISDAYIPVLKETKGHWFRDVYFYLAPGDEYVEEDEDYFLTTGEKWTKYDISEEEGQKILTPSMLKAEEGWNAYEIINRENEENLGKPMESSDEKYTGLSEFVYIFEENSVEARQRQEGRRGMTNPRTKKLFTDVEWYKYDGSKDKADENNEDRKKALADRNPLLKSKIEPDNDMLAAFEILEGSKSLDSQYILKDLKELYVELGYYEKEDLRDPIRRILRWPLAEYGTPEMWPAAEVHQDSEAYGVYIPSKPTLEAIYDEETLENNVNVVGEGFEEEELVVSPVTGRIEDIGKKDITRLVADKDGNLERIEYKDVGYITISAIDETAPKEANPYMVFYDTEYKGVISGKVKHGKQESDNRYIEGNKITIEGLDVEIPGDVNNPENSRYLRQVRESDIKKVQELKTREAAEAKEQEKMDAPNYIYINGSEAHVGDYIKEGTVIGKTTEADIKIVMQDADKAFVENVDLYLVLKSSSTLELMNDYYTKVEDGEPNFITDIDLFRHMLEGFPFLQDNAQAFLDMQEKYNVSAIFAAAVTIQECSGGNAKQGLNHSIKQKYGGDHNNIFSIKGSATDLVYHADYGEGSSPWNVFRDAEEATDFFARLISSDTNKLYWSADRYFVSEIGPVYCNEDWSVAVNGHMSMLIERGMKKLGITPNTIGGMNLPSAVGGQMSPEMFQRVQAEAMKHVGKPYVFGTQGPSTFDCSGFVWYVYKQSGFYNDSRRGAIAQFSQGQPIYNYADGRPGDLIFFHSTTGNEGPSVITHVGLYLGNNRMVHAGSTKTGVNIADTSGSYYQQHFYGFSRYNGNNY